ncbi:hypothetical protein HK097_005744, partial [Rhizophlyctis rosea]
LALVLIIGFDLFCYAAVRQVCSGKPKKRQFCNRSLTPSCLTQMVRLYEYTLVWRGKSLKHLTALHSAQSYAEYSSAGEALDKHLGNDIWKQEGYCTHYDQELVMRVVRRLKRYRKIVERCRREVEGRSRDEEEKEDGGEVEPPTPGTEVTPDPFTPVGETGTPYPLSIEILTQTIRSITSLLLHGGIKSNLGGIEKEDLYSHSYMGTVKPVEEYYDEVVKCLEVVRWAGTEGGVLGEAERREFWERARRMFGRTALCLSGGATLGYYHCEYFEVWWKLVENVMWQLQFLGFWDWVKSYVDVSSRFQRGNEPLRIGCTKRCEHFVVGRMQVVVHPVQ